MNDSPVPIGGMIGQTLVERRLTHGDFDDDARVSQAIKAAMCDSENWNRLSVAQTEALEQIATKIGRILSGDPNYKEHWVDMIGYATLVLQRL